MWVLLYLWMAVLIFFCVVPVLDHFGIDVEKLWNQGLTGKIKMVGWLIVGAACILIILKAMGPYGDRLWGRQVD